MNRTIFVVLLAFIAYNSCVLCTSDCTNRKRADDLALSSLHTLVQQQSAVIQKQSADLQALKAELTALTSRVTTSEGVIQKLQQKVAFTAFFNSGGPINIGESAAVAFDHVSSNVGNGYNSQSGVFTAPVSGVYLFLLSVRATDSAHTFMKLGLVKSSSVILETIINHNEQSVWEKSTSFITVHVSSGETLFVKHVGGPTAVDKWQDTSFAGILLCPD